ncbi:hypothetical protein [Photobacterium angustum]|nr:hypothetical protein [Photobacterium angustum]
MTVVFLGGEISSWPLPLFLPFRGKRARNRSHGRIALVWATY